MIKYINKILISIFLLCSSFTSILANYNETNTQYSNTQAYSNYKENALDNLDWGNKIIGIFQKDAKISHKNFLNQGPYKAKVDENEYIVLDTKRTDNNSPMTIDFWVDHENYTIIGKLQIEQSPSTNYPLGIFSIKYNAYENITIDNITTNTQVNFSVQIQNSIEGTYNSELKLKMLEGTKIVQSLKSNINSNTNITTTISKDDDIKAYKLIAQLGKYYKVQELNLTNPSINTTNFSFHNMTDIFKHSYAYKLFYEENGTEVKKDINITNYNQTSEKDWNNNSINNGEYNLTYKYNNKPNEIHRNLYVLFKNNLELNIKDGTIVKDQSNIKYVVKNNYYDIEYMNINSNQKPTIEEDTSLNNNFFNFDFEETIDPVLTIDISSIKANLPTNATLKVENGIIKDEYK